MSETKLRNTQEKSWEMSTEFTRLLPAPVPVTPHWKDVVKKHFSKCCTTSSLKQKFPISQWLPKYRFSYLRSDIIAGLTVTLTVIPQGLAYAKIARLPPQYGLYAAFMGCFVYCILGTAKDITLGPTAIMSLMTAAFGNSPVNNDPTYAILLAFFCGIIQLLMGFFNLGILVNFISYPVINSFTSAAAITISIGQVKNILGLKKIPRDFLKCVYYTFAKLGETNVWDLLLGVSCLVLVHFIKKLRSINWMDTDETIHWSQKIARNFLWLFGTAANAVIVISASAISYAVISQNPDKNIFTLTNDIQEGLPPFRIPDFSIHTKNVTRSTSEILSDIGPGFIIIPILGILETIAIGKAFARKNHYKLDPTQEFIALGAANVISSFCSSYPVAGSFSRTAINSQSGVKTPFGNIITGSAVLLALKTFTPVVKYIPAAALAAIIIHAVVGMIDTSIVMKLWRLKKIDLVIYVITFVMSLCIGIEYGILIGIAVSLITLLYPLSRPNIQIHQAATPVLYLELGLQFPAIDYFEDKFIDLLNTGDEPKAIIVDCQYIYKLDYTAIQCLFKLVSELNQRNISLILSGLRPSVRNEIVNADITPLLFSSSVESAQELIMKS
ncbi:sodium-independent sulfate anion transporter isoform X2 [Octopus sinensis]|uniref:Sodium-independent sulfate anion transporter isoform X2 n=1 Tax=Octopus sinensis TaxID=2607531 RepID=A0A7E6F262_9MOLL|nr:sodium-independent sulfate anion transporter isoform X2 [Octopus sinensis]